MKSNKAPLQDLIESLGEPQNSFSSPDTKPALLGIFDEILRDIVYLEDELTTSGILMDELHKLVSNLMFRQYPSGLYATVKFIH